MPKDEPLAPNPPVGAMIDYSASGNAAGRCRSRSTIRPGALVNRFGSATICQSRSTSQAPGRPRMGVTRAAAASTPGHHRFVWDLHYAKPAGIEGEQEPESGPLPAIIPSS